MIPMRIWSFLPWFPSNNFCRTGHEIEKKFAELKFMPIFAIPIGNTIDSSYLFCGNSSVGRAQPCQGWGREFESRFPLQFQPHFGGAIFVYISWLCCFGVAVLPFRSVLDFAAKFRKIGRKEGDFGGLFTPTFTPVGIGTLRLLIL